MWPKTTLLPVWPGDAKRLGTPAPWWTCTIVSCGFQCLEPPWGGDGMWACALLSLSGDRRGQDDWLWRQSWGRVPLLLRGSSGSLAGHLTLKSSISMPIMGVPGIQWRSISDGFAQGRHMSKCSVMFATISIRHQHGSDFPASSLPVAVPVSPAQLLLVPGCAGIPLPDAAFPSERLFLCHSFHVTGSAGKVLDQ